MFRLLELFSEQGSGGVVDKIIISQESVSHLVELIKPGAYSSLTKVTKMLCGFIVSPANFILYCDTTKIDFAALDKVILKPVGVYGSLPSLVEFLADIGAVDPGTYGLPIANPT